MADDDEKYWNHLTAIDVEDLSAIVVDVPERLRPSQASEYTGAGDISLVMEYSQEPAPSQSVASTSSSSQSSTTLGKRKASEPIDIPQHHKRHKLGGDSYPTSHAASWITPDGAYLIAHSPLVQRLFSERAICSGVRYQLARLISAGQISYSDITEDRLDELVGNNEDAAPNVELVFGLATTSVDVVDDLAFAAEKEARSPWKELDREEEALSKSYDNGLGHSANYPGWYGGRIEFSGKLQKETAQSQSYKVQLENCAIGPSCRFARRFGSWSFVRVKIPSNLFYDKNSKLELFFQNKFIVWDQVFRACYAKGDNVFFYKTNEIYPGGGSSANGLSFEEFIDAHNPLHYGKNPDQLMTKWAARMPLGFSNTVPGPKILQPYIRREPDIISESEGKSVMTDGCGLTSKSAHIYLYNQLSLPKPPTAFQFRLAGFKGMSLLRDDNHQDAEVRGHFRPSQQKIDLPILDTQLDPSHLIFDIVRTSALRTPAYVSADMIINLAENGVPHQAFIDLMRKSLEGVITGLTAWDGPDAMYNLWLKVERTEGIFSARRAREAVGEARVRGYRNRTPGEDEMEDDEEEDEDGLASNGSGGPKSTAWWADNISGCPSSLAETVMVLLDSGFHPRNCAVLRDKLFHVVSGKIRSKTQSLRFEVEQSLSAFVVPDPKGVLKENEIHVKSSKTNLLLPDGSFTDAITGDVLMGRNPCKIPTDIRKLKAVVHSGLVDYTDVIVCSVQGHRRLLDFLAGGDYDGDTAVVIWDPVLVQNFENADETYADEPPELDAAFTRDQESGGEFLKRIKDLSTEDRIHARQKYLLGGLCDTSLVGKYSTMHDSAIYQLGYGHPTTVLLAYKFCRVLDAPKTGYRILRAVYNKDRQMHTGVPLWKEKVNKAKAEKDKGPKKLWSGPMTNQAVLTRKKSSFTSKKFVMDVLQGAAEVEKNKYLAEMEQLFKGLDFTPDPDLTKPWSDAEAWATRGNPDFVKLKRMDLSRIAEHVKGVYWKHKFQTSKGKNTPGNAGPSRSSSFTDQPIEARQDKLRSMSKLFASGPALPDLPTIIDEATLARLRASYAYKYDADERAEKEGAKWSRFPWDTTMRELCKIKAEALGPHKMVANGFYERFRLARYS